MRTKLSSRFWIALTLFGLFGQVAWVVENMYLNVFMYNMFRATPEDISMMVSASAVTATLTTVLIGALSDRLGKRKVFICAGYILWGISVMSFGLIREQTIHSLFFPMVSFNGAALSLCITLTITLDCLMTFFGSSANDAAFNAWLTDSTDESNRGAAEGVNAMMPLVAILVVFGSCMFMDQTKADHWSIMFLLIGAATLLVGILGFFLIKDTPAQPSKTGYWQNVIYGFRHSTIKKNAKLYFYLALFILFNIAIQIFMPYLIIYYEKTLQMANYVLIMAPAIVLASVATVFWGRVYDKKGFFFSAITALIALIAGFVILFIFTDMVMVFIGSLLMMCGYLCGMAVFGARIRDLTPSGKAGMLQGVRIFSQVLIPGVVGPYIGTLVLAGAKTIPNGDGTESFLPNEYIFLAAMVPAIIVLVTCLLQNKKK